MLEGLQLRMASDHVAFIFKQTTKRRAAQSCARAKMNEESVVARGTMTIHTPAIERPERTTPLPPTSLKQTYTRDREQRFPELEQLQIVFVTERVALSGSLANEPHKKSLLYRNRTRE